MAQIIMTEGRKAYGELSIPSYKNDLYRYYASDIADVREQVCIGQSIPLRLRYKRDTPVDVTAFVSEKYQYHCVVSFIAPSGRLSHRSVMYLDVLLGYVKIPGITTVRDGKIPIPDFSRVEQDSE